MNEIIIIDFFYLKLKNLYCRHRSNLAASFQHSLKLQIYSSTIFLSRMTKITAIVHSLRNVLSPQQKARFRNSRDTSKRWHR